MIPGARPRPDSCILRDQAPLGKGATSDEIDGLTRVKGPAPYRTCQLIIALAFEPPLPGIETCKVRAEHACFEIKGPSSRYWNRARDRDRIPAACPAQAPAADERAAFLRPVADRATYRPHRQQVRFRIGFALTECDRVRTLARLGCSRCHGLGF